MKKFTPYLLLLAISCLVFSCLKDSVGKQTNGGLSLAGNWTLINDSSVTSFWGLWAGRAPVGSNYTGKTSDYYNFNQNGNISIVDDTDKYAGTYITHLNLVRFNFSIVNGAAANPYPGTEYFVSNLTAHTVTLADTLISPETITTRTINLER